MFCAILGLLCGPQVDAFYYPNSNDLTVHAEFIDVGSIENCRSVVYAEAANNGDPTMALGDYECGVGVSDKYGSLRVYEKTVR